MVGSIAYVGGRHAGKMGRSLGACRCPVLRAVVVAGVSVGGFGRRPKGDLGEWMVRPLEVRRMGGVTALGSAAT